MEAFFTHVAEILAITLFIMCLVGYYEPVASIWDNEFLKIIWFGTSVGFIGIIISSEKGSSWGISIGIWSTAWCVFTVLTVIRMIYNAA